MNKKIISILLIFSLLTVGLTSVAANETTKTTSNSEPIGAGEGFDEIPSDYEEIEPDSSSEKDDSFVIADDENNTVSNETESSNSTSDTNTSNDKSSKFMGLLNKLDNNEANELLNILSVSDNPNIKGLYEALLNYNGDDLNLLEALNSLNDDEYDAIMTILFILTEDNSGSSAAPASNSHATQKVSYSEKITSTEGSTSNNNIINAVFAPKKSSKIIPDNKKQDSYSNNLFDKIIGNYFEGDITFDEMIAALALLGYDTSGIEQNPDGTFTWDGFLFTKNGVFEQDNQEVIDDKNSTDAKSNNTDVADNTGSTDSIEDAENTEDSTPSNDESEAPANNNANNNVNNNPKTGDVADNLI